LCVILLTFIIIIIIIIIIIGTIYTLGKGRWLF